MDKNLDQIKKVKLNLNNIHSILVRDNKDQKKIISKKEKTSVRQISKKKLKNEEQKLESPIKSSLNKVKESTGSSSGSSGGSIFDKILEFGGLLLTGIIVNALPAIIEKVKEIIDNITNFLKPVQSGFTLIKAFLTGEFNDSKLDVDKKKFDDGLNDITGKDGLIDKIAEKMGPFGGLIKMLKPAINSVRGAIGGEKIVYAKKDGKEGVLNRETGIFTERQFTSTKNKKNVEYYGPAFGPNGETEELPESSGETPINSDDPSVRIDDHHPRSQAASPGGSGKPFEAGTRYKNGKIFLHWTAGTYTSTYGTYHTIFTGDGKAHRKASYDTFRDGHTWGRNDEGVALSIAALGDKTSQGRWPSKDDHGKYPIKSVQIQSMAEEIARLAIAWDWKKSDIKLGRVYTHAEIAREENPPYGPNSRDPETKWDLWNLKSGAPEWSGGPEIRKLAKKYYDKMKNDKNEASGGNIRATGITMQRSSYVPKIDERKMAAINQPMYEDLDDEEEMVNVYIQPINTTRTVYNYQPIPV